MSGTINIICINEYTININMYFLYYIFTIFFKIIQMKNIK